MKWIIIAAILAYASAECANACSGHGNCGTKDHCTCYRNWQGADCSERTCQFGLAFIDTPQGDLNHDGDVTDTTSDVQWNQENSWEMYPSVAAQESHTYMECSNKGICNRNTARCQCFPGYEGSACQRTVCPNKCSGHGVCRTVKEIARGALTKHFVKHEVGTTYYEGVVTPFDYNLWDADKNQACVCDAGYTGPDCSLRECPRGDDPLTYKNVDCAGAACRNEKQTLTLKSTATDLVGNFTLSFTDWDDEVWTTFPIVYNDWETAYTTACETEVQAVFEDALERIPNNVVPAVTVTATCTGANDFTVLFEFTANSGDLPIMTLDTTFLDGTIHTTTGLAATQDGNKEAVVCSNRGLCDFTTGDCTCFKGYTDVACSTQSALSM